jgi:hypothetical protein
MSGGRSLRWRVNPEPDHREEYNYISFFSISIRDSIAQSADRSNCVYKNLYSVSAQEYGIDTNKIEFSRD